MSVEVKVWDWPLRLFHWLLVVSVVGAYWTGKVGGEWTDWHARFGSTILGLLVFRIGWGFFGSAHARFINFFPTWSRLRDYLRGEWSGVGHNPVGAFAVFALLAVLIALVGTGLFANDDIAFEGPLFDLIDKDFSDSLSGWHLKIVNVLLGLVALHVSAIVYYQRLKKADLLLPMLTGKKRLPAAHEALHPTVNVSPARLIVILLLAGTAVVSVWTSDPFSYLAQLVGVQSAQAAATR